MKKSNRWWLGFALLATSLGVFAGCSSEAGVEPSGGEAAGSVAEELGYSCGSADPSKTVTRGFEKPYVSAASYSDCYKGVVVQIDGYDAKYIVGGHTRISWGDAVPSNADCTSTMVNAYLMRLVHHPEDNSYEWVRVAYKEAHGDLLMDDVPSDIVGPPAQPKDLSGYTTAGGGTTVAIKDPSIFGPPIKTPPKCRPPEIFFHGHEMPAATFKIAASARSSGNVLHPVKFESIAGTCGQGPGKACCYSGEACGLGLNCNGSTKKCESCGTVNGACCAANDLADAECFSQAVCGGNGKCNACGGQGQPCCEQATVGQRGPFDLCYGSGSKCVNNKCFVTVAPPCGGKGQSCCDGRPNPCDGTLRCDFWTDKCQPPWDGGPTCFSEGDKCSGTQSCCTGSTCDPFSSVCIRNPNTKPGYDNFACDEPGDVCCENLKGPNFCDSVFYPSLRCNSQNQCSTKAD
jgi:hypothetical protein